MVTALNTKSDLARCLAEGADDFVGKPFDSTELRARVNSLLRIKAQYDELENLIQLREESLKFREEMSNMIVHDLRNPLTAAAIAIETLQSNYNPDTGGFQRLKSGLAMHLLKQARTQTKIIDRMIADLLQAGRGDDTELPIVPQKLQLGEICLQVLEELSDRYIAKSQRVETDIPQDLPSVYADPERIRQVLVNLLDNAIKYKHV
jgi:two-component system clock-associated histidine kinase SasA